MSTLLSQLEVALPIIQAPMAGVSTPELAAAVAEHQVADDDQAPAIPQRLKSQIDRAARAWGVYARSKNQLRYKISRSSLQPIA